MNRAINSALGTTRTRQKIEAKLTRGNESNANTFVNFALCILSWNTNFQDYLIRVSIAVIKDVILKVLRGEIQEDMNLDLALQILKPVDINRRAMPSCPRAESFIVPSRFTHERPRHPRGLELRGKFRFCVPTFWLSVFWSESAIKTTFISSRVMSITVNLKRQSSLITILNSNGWRRLVFFSPYQRD